MRPRERLLNHGSKALSNEELLAIILRNGTKTRNAIELAGDLLRQTGGFRKILFSDIKELSRFTGIGLAKWAELQACYELVKRALEEQLSTHSAIEQPGLLREFLQTAIGYLDHEVFACLFLNQHHELIEFREMFRGDSSQTAIYPKEIAKEALKRNAHALIVCHNHPSGNPLPSKADRELTGILQKILAFVDIALLDHCIVTSNGYFSFKDANLLKNKDFIISDH